MTDAGDKTSLQRAAVSAPQAGFSLLELMMLLVAAVTLICATLQATIQHAAQRQIYSERSLALDSARNVLEELRTLDAASLPGMNGSGFDVPGPNGEARGLHPVAGDADGLPGRIVMVPDTVVGTVTLYRVSVTVRWRGRDPSGTLTIESLLGGRRL